MSREFRGISSRLINWQYSRLILPFRRDRIVGEEFAAGHFRRNKVLVRSPACCQAEGKKGRQEPLASSFNLLGVFGVRLTLAYLCGFVLHGGLIGAWIGMCCDNTVRAILVALLFRRGRWMSKSL